MCFLGVGAKGLKQGGLDLIQNPGPCPSPSSVSHRTSWRSRPSGHASVWPQGSPARGLDSAPVAPLPRRLRCSWRSRHWSEILLGERVMSGVYDTAEICIWRHFRCSAFVAMVVSVSESRDKISGRVHNLRCDKCIDERIWKYRGSVSSFLARSWRLIMSCESCPWICHFQHFQFNIQWGRGSFWTTVPIRLTKIVAEQCTAHSRQIRTRFFEARIG